MSNAIELIHFPGVRGKKVSQALSCPTAVLPGGALPPC